MMTRLKPGAYEGFHWGVYYTVLKTEMTSVNGTSTGWSFRVGSFYSELHASKEMAAAAAIRHIEGATA